MKFKKGLKEVLEFLVMLAIMLAVVFGLRHFVAESFQIQGHSMDYTLADGERLFMWKLAKVDRFDVVVIPAPDNSKKLYIKRVIGVPGDSIEVKNGKLILNGKETDEPYLAQKEAEAGGAVTRDFTLEQVAGAKVVPEGKLFVMGDNRQNSLDGRAFGFIDLASVKGEADVIYWPFDRLGLLDKYKLNDAGEIVKR